MSPLDIMERLRIGADPHGLALGVLGAALEQSDFVGSKYDCHHKGLDSVVLYDERESNGGMLRLFFAYGYQHTLDDLYTEAGHYTLGVHNHRYPLALVPIFGQVGQTVPMLDGGSFYGRLLHEYSFTSALGGEMGVEYRNHLHGLTGHVIDWLEPGDVCFMETSDIHTVSLQPGADAAWLVVEGPNEPGAVSRIFSPRADLTISSQGLYTDMRYGTAFSIVHDALAQGLANLAAA